MQTPGRPIPTTFEYIESIALREPRRLAVVQNRRSWSYEAFYKDLIGVARLLERIGVRRGQRVAVGTVGLQAGLLLLIASEMLGATTTSFLARSDADAEAVFGLVDWVISDHPQACPAGVRFQLLDGAFAAQLGAIDAADGEPCPRVVLHPHEPLRISRTSGSSGKSKFMLLTRQAQEGWIRDGAENGGYTPDSRLLVTGPLVMNAVYARACACLRLGGAVLDLKHAGPQAHDFTHVLALPAMLEDFLDRLPVGFQCARRVEVATVGGFVPAQLRQRAARVFGGRIASRYGTNETSGICDDMDAEGKGVVSAGVDIRIVDEQGADLPPGAIGIIAVRTPSMVEGYLGDEAASRRSFRDGWFHSGDWGVLLAPRVLQLAGRHDDLINVGGVKLPALRMENQLRELSAVRDCAVQSVNLHASQVTVGIAIVAARDAARGALAQAVRDKLQLGATVGARLLFLDELPRLSSGKLDRLALQRLFQSSQ